MPTLILNHQNKELSDYVWHWFLINGYDEQDGSLLVKTVTYSSWRWVDLKALWDTGHGRRGGFVLYEEAADRDR